MSLADVQTKLIAAVTALEAGDYAQVGLLLDSAEILMAGIPDSDHAGVELTFARNQIDSVRESVRRRQASRTGIQRRKMRFVNP